MRDLIPQDRKRAADKRIRLLLGVDPLPGVDPEDSTPGGTEVSRVAAALGVAPQLIHASLQTLRRTWHEAACREERESAVRAAVDAQGPACTFEQAAEHLIDAHGSPSVPVEAQRDDAIALVCLASELRPAPVEWRRLGATAWLALQGETLMTVGSLAAAADDLAGQEPLPSIETVRERLLALVAGTPLEVLPPDRLVSLAARASQAAAASARMELYPRGMSAGRALTLSASVLSAQGLTAEMVHRRVRARYPEAEELPTRPALDELLRVHGLQHDEHLNVYVRPGETSLSASGTAQAPTRLTSAGPTQRRQRTPDALEAQAFEDALDRGVESGGFRVVQVRADRAPFAEKGLAEHRGVDPTPLDPLLWATAMEKAKAAGVQDLDRLVRTDREGPEGKDWGELVGLTKTTAADVVASFLKEREQPRLLVQLGSLARFRLVEALNELAHKTQFENGLIA